MNSEAHVLIGIRTDMGLKYIAREAILKLREPNNELFPALGSFQLAGG
jgi:hypothetical protein